MERYIRIFDSLNRIIFVSAGLLTAVFVADNNAVLGTDQFLRHDWRVVTLSFLGATIVLSLVAYWLTNDFYLKVKKRPRWMDFMPMLYAGVFLLFIASIVLFVRSVI